MTSTSSADTTSGDAEAICQAYATKLGQCFPRTDEQQVVQDCEELLTYYAMAGADCYSAIQGLYLCRSEATCRELMGDACASWDDMVETNCV